MWDGCPRFANAYLGRKRWGEAPPKNSANQVENWQGSITRLEDQTDLQGVGRVPRFAKAYLGRKKTGRKPPPKNSANQVAK